jgi:hypothetical protein
MKLVERAREPFKPEAGVGWIRRYDFAQDNMVRYIRRSIYRTATQLLELKGLIERAEFVAGGQHERSRLRSILAEIERL